MKKINYLLLSILSISLYGSSDDYLLDSVVVTGTKTPRLQHETPIKTEVISEKTIEQNHGNSLEKVLDIIPGLTIQRSHGKEGFEVWMQGFDSDRVLVLIDGRSPVATTGATVDLSQIALIDIQRIEVVKGATSALYGSSAMGGVINIITKKSEGGFKAKVEATGGSYLDKAVDSKVKASIGVLLEQSTANYEWRVNGTYKYDPGLAYETGNFHQDTQESTYIDFGLYGAYKNNDDKYFIGIDRFSEDKYHPTQSIQPGLGLRDYERIEDVSALTYYVGSENFIGENKLSIDISKQKYNSISKSEKVATSWLDDKRETNIDKDRIEIQFDQFLSNHIITYGIVAQSEDMTQDKIQKTSETEVLIREELAGNQNRKSYEAYIQDDWFWSDDLEILSGLRIQNEDSFGTHATPKINLSYKSFKNETLNLDFKGGVGAGYRAPTIKELYYEFDQSHHGYKVLGNEHLEPEESISVQLGVELLVNNKLFVDLYVFNNKVTNLIETAPDLELTELMGLNISRYQNIAKANMNGVEVSWKVPFYSFYYNGGYTYLNAENKTTGLDLIKRPKHQIKNNLTYNGSFLTAVLTLNYQSKVWADEENLYRSPSYYSADLKFTKDFTKDYSLLLGIENITDEHSDASDVYDLRPTDGRYVYAGVRLKY